MQELLSAAAEAAAEGISGLGGPADPADESVGTSKAGALLQVGLICSPLGPIQLWVPEGQDNLKTQPPG